MAFEIDIGYTSNAAGREVNEDFCAAMLPETGHEDRGAVAALADGVSTGGRGREAAQTTAMSVVRDYFGTPETWDVSVALDRIINAQSSWLAAQNRHRAPEIGMTALTALVLRGHGYTVAHVGDTRAYLLRDGALTQITHDHVVNHPDMRHQLLRTVGGEEHVAVDFHQGEAQQGDVYLLLSDGVHGTLPHARLQSLLSEHSGDARSLSDALVNEAIARRTRDNASALVIRVVGLLAEQLDDETRRAQELAPPRALNPGEAIDGLVVETLVVDNGVHLLYRVQDPQSGKRYALKALKPKRAIDPQERALLAHEAWLAKRMQTSAAGEYLARIHAPPSGAPTAFYLLYDWLDGETLDDLIKRRDAAMPLMQITSIASHVARALGRLHRQNVIHRDVKPENLMLGTDGIPRLLDLGVALSGREPQSTRELHAGTPSYINPEQWGFAPGSGDPEPEEPDAQSDLFALGVTLYEMLTRGRLPYGEVLPYQSGRYYKDPPAPSRYNPEVPVWLDHIAQKAVARDKRARFETAEEFLLALERGAARPLSAPAATPLFSRDPTALWKIALGISVLFNVLLIVWLFTFPPH